MYSTNVSVSRLREFADIPAFCIVPISFARLFEKSFISPMADFLMGGALYSSAQALGGFTMFSIKLSVWARFSQSAIILSSAASRSAEGSRKRARA